MLSSPTVTPQSRALQMAGLSASSLPLASSAAQAHSRSICSDMIEFFMVD